MHYNNGVPAPHKAILLLAISDLIEFKNILDNKIYMTDELKIAFEQRWSKHINSNSSYKCSVWTPFWHLDYESFWNFEPQEGISIDFIKTLAEGHTASIGKMKQYIQYAKLDKNLFALLLNDRSRNALNNVLINKWLNYEQY